MLLFITLSNCSNVDALKETKVLSINFSAEIEGELIAFESQKYSTANDQTISLDRMIIYLSNFILTDLSSGAQFTDTDSYYLSTFDKNNSTYTIKIDNIPSNLTVSKITFSIGIDADANTSIDNVGDLDPANGMAWDWNTGYKFFFLEGGYYPNQDADKQEIVMHIGTDHNYFTKEYLLDPNPLDRTSDQSIDFIVNGMAAFGMTDFSSNTVFQFGPDADQIAKNYKDTLFKLK